MYPELEKYFNGCIGKDLADTEQEELLKFLAKLHRINLLTNQEYNDITEKLDGFLCKKVRHMPLSVRAHNVLKRGDICFYQQLRDLLINADGNERLFNIRNLGRRTMAEIIDISCQLELVTIDEVRNAGWTYIRKTIIEEILS